MPSLADPIVSLLSPFASRFDVRIWRKVPILIGGHSGPGRRTESSALYALGLQEGGRLGPLLPCSQPGAASTAGRILDPVGTAAVGH